MERQHSIMRMHLLGWMVEFQRIGKTPMYMYNISTFIFKTWMV